MRKPMEGRSMKKWDLTLDLKAVTLMVRAPADVASAASDVAAFAKDSDEEGGLDSI